jgi:hypothetical protein
MKRLNQPSTSNKGGTLGNFSYSGGVPNSVFISSTLTAVRIINNQIPTSILLPLTLETDPG